MWIILLLLLPWEGRSVPVYGGLAEFGYYFADVQVGTPPQRMSVIVDTGSEGLSVACVACTSCGRSHMDPFFNPEISTSFINDCSANLRNQQCSFEKRYLEGSLLKGRMFTDRIGFPDLQSSKSIPFGCIESETKLFLSQKANGILGLAPLPKTYWLFDETDFKIDAFSLCLSKQGGDLEFHQSPVSSNQQVNLSYVEGHYVVTPSGISVGTNWTANSTQIPHYTGTQVLLDSGSTVTYLKKELFAVVFALVQEAVSSHNHQFPTYVLTLDSSGPSACWNGVPQKPFSEFLPILTFRFPTSSGTELSVPFEKYSFIENDKQCLSIASNADLARTDLGASWMIGKNITFSTTAGWIHMNSSAACSERITRSPAQPIPGQVPTLTPSGTVPRLVTIFILAGMAFCLVKVVKRSVVQEFVTDSVE